MRAIKWQIGALGVGADVGDVVLLLMPSLPFPSGFSEPADVVDSVGLVLGARVGFTAASSLDNTKLFLGGNFARLAMQSSLSGVGVSPPGHTLHADEPKYFDSEYLPFGHWPHPAAAILVEYFPPGKEGERSNN